jgi:hypothetical protein
VRAIAAPPAKPKKIRVTSEKLTLRHLRNELGGVT